MPRGGQNKKSPVRKRKSDTKPPTPKHKRRKITKEPYEAVGGDAAQNNNSDVCSKNLDDLLMGNPPVKMAEYDVGKEWKNVKGVANDMGDFAVKGWGNYPGTPPKPNCTIL